MENNVFDTAFIIEGGGMKAAYTAGLINVLLENKIYFDNIYGVSAGSSHTVNYATRDEERVKKSFVDLVKDPDFGGWGNFLKGKGYFNAYHLYEGIAEDNTLAFDYQTFMKNPAKVTIPSYNTSKGKTVFWTKDDMKSGRAVMEKVRSSSTVPFLMKPCIIEGDYYYDGGLGEGGGILVDKAKRDGFNKFFIILSHEKGFRHEKEKRTRLLKRMCKDDHNLYRAIVNRHLPYNKTMDEIDRLEAQGLAYVVRPDKPIGKLTEKNYQRLENLYWQGYEYGKKDIKNWLEFLS
jgi:predicted patatin/cPLA2 family phospholipase